MKTQQYTAPFNIFFIVFPNGISQGFVTVALPFLLTKHGFSVAETAGIVALGVSANLWRFLWGPIVDMSLSLKKWYWISVAAIIASMMVLGFINYNHNNSAILSIVVFVSQVAATFLVMPITGFMAKCVAPSEKGAAAGWYQGGSLAGVGLGGGVGLWMANHFNIPIAVITLCGISLLFSLFIVRLRDVHHTREQHLWHEIVSMGKDLVSMVKIPVALFALILICLPIGSGACANLWSAIANDWHTDADTVALVTGILSGLISAVGCVVGGYIADKLGVFNGYMISGGMCALVTVIMAVLPYNTTVFVGGVLLYTFCLGLINAAFSAVLLFAIGKKNVATKYAILASFGNLPVVYMTAINGWAHDHYNSKVMLLSEAVLGFGFIVLCLLVIRQMSKRQLLQPVAE